MLSNFKGVARERAGRGLGRGLGKGKAPSPRKFLEFRTSNRSISMVYT